MKNPGLLLSLVLLAAGSVAPASAAVLKPSFAPVVQYPAGFHDSTGALVADVNHDGKMDIVVTSLCSEDFCTTAGSVNVLLGNGDGTFQAPATYASGGIFALALAAADVNHDGNLDVLVVNQCPTGLTVSCGAVTTGSGTVGILLGNGDGTFQAAVPYNTGGLNPASIAVGDVNKDGKMDLLVANMCGAAGCASSGLGEAGVLLGNGDGTFRTAVEYPTGGYGAVSIAVADLDADGKLDLAVANSCIDAGCSSSGIGSLLGNGDGTFRAATSFPSGSFGANDLVVADFNRDGKFDVAVAHNDYPSSGVVGLLLGNGNGTLQAPTASTSGGIAAFSMAVGDFNGDGNPDLAIYNGCGGSACNMSAIGVLSGRGDGTFRTDVFHADGFATSNGPNIVAVGDVNGDGKPDLVVANNSATGQAGVLLNNLPRVTTHTVLTQSAKTSRVGQSVTFTATISGLYAGKTSGSVTFLQGTTALGTVAVANGKASLAHTFTTAGSFSMTAAFSGDGNSLPSTSAAITHTVTP